MLPRKVWFIIVCPVYSNTLGYVLPPAVGVVMTFGVQGNLQLHLKTTGWFFVQASHHRRKWYLPLTTTAQSKGRTHHLNIIVYFRPKFWTCTSILPRQTGLTGDINDISSKTCTQSYKKNPTTTTTNTSNKVSVTKNSCSTHHFLFWLDSGCCVLYIVIGHVGRSQGILCKTKMANSNTFHI